MHESDTYQAIIDEGQVRGVQRFLLRLARQRLGEPDERTRRVFESIVALDRLDRLGDQLQHVSTWQELLAIP